MTYTWRKNHTWVLSLIMGRINSNGNDYKNKTKEISGGDGDTEVGDDVGENVEVVVSMCGIWEERLRRGWVWYLGGEIR